MCEHRCENCGEADAHSAPEMLCGVPQWSAPDCCCVQAPCGHWFCFICAGRGRAEQHLEEPLTDCMPAVCVTLGLFLNLCARAA